MVLVEQINPCMLAKRRSSPLAGLQTIHSPQQLKALGVKIVGRPTYMSSYPSRAVPIRLLVLRVGWQEFKVALIGNDGG